MIVVGLIDHAITLLFAVWMAPCERSRCTHAWDRGLESLAFGRARSAVSIFGFIHPVVRAGRSEPELCAFEGRTAVDELAAMIDDSALELIRYCLRRAPDESIEVNEAWLDTARDALGEDGPERAIVTPSCGLAKTGRSKA